jgi:hypothetical protein
MAMSVNSFVVTEGGRARQPRGFEDQLDDRLGLRDGGRV